MPIKPVIETGWLVDGNADANNADVLGSQVTGLPCSFVGFACPIATHCGGGGGGGGLGASCGGSPTQSCNILTSDPVCQS